VINLRVALQYLSAFFLLLVFLCAVVPLTIFFFCGVLPYLHQYSLSTRVTIAFLFWCVAIAFYFLISSEEQRKSVSNTIQYKPKDWLGAFLGVLLFSFTTGWLSANILGVMVKLTPSASCIIEAEVIHAKSYGSRNKSMRLDLKTKIDGSIYYLSLSERQFKYPNFKIGDSLTLKCKQNFFGVYVEDFSINN
jgi:hypothetical protein